MEGLALPEIDRDDLEFFEQLSTGSFGAVYRARWISANKPVAVKRVFVLEKEAEILSTIRHKNIIHFFGVCSAHPDFCIVTEFAEKGSLFHYLASTGAEGVECALLLRWALQIAEGMRYLHGDAPVPIVHRDLKSKNVVVTAADVCKLCDFGTSKARGQTVGVSVAGTVPWMSPEMISQRERVGPETDVWSFAVVLWELLTREVPFKGLNEFKVSMLIVEENVRLTVPNSCPPALSALINDCWKTAPSERPNFVEIVNRLGEMQHDRALEADADRFLRQKSQWQGEIDSQLTMLAEKEKELAEKEEALQQRERRLHERERQLRAVRERRVVDAASPGAGDVQHWDEQLVCAWLASLDLGMPRQHAAVLEGLVHEHHINGRRLLMLTNRDLRNLGLHSVGYEVQLKVQIDRLSFDNRRLRNFPSLTESRKQQMEDERRRTAQPQQRHLAVVFGAFARPLPCGTVRYKLYADCDWSQADDVALCFDDDDDDDDLPQSLIKRVQFCPQSSDPVTLESAPFVQRSWSSVESSAVARIRCIVSFSDCVLAPRNTRLAVEPPQWTANGFQVEKCIAVTVKPSCGRRRAAAGGCAHRSLQPSESMPQLQGVWQQRALDGPLLDGPPIAAEPRRPKHDRSPLWADIAASIVRPDDYDRKLSMPTPSPVASTRQPPLRVFSVDPAGPPRRRSLRFSAESAALSRGRRGASASASTDYHRSQSEGRLLDLVSVDVASELAEADLSPVDEYHAAGDDEGDARDDGRAAQSTYSRRVHGGYKKWSWRHS